MRHIFELCFVFCLFISCSEDDILLPVEPADNIAQEKPTTTTNTPPAREVSGLTRFKVSELNIPSDGLPDARRFYKDGILRASTAYNPQGITTVRRNSQTLIRYYVNPTDARDYLSSSPYKYHHRAEFSRYPWRINHPLHTEEWIGFSYIFPTAEEGFTYPATPVNIYQNHAGSVEGQESNPPALKLEIAYAGQLKSSDPSRQTPLGGEIMICNKILDYRYVAQGVRVTPGSRLDIVIQIVYGLESKGLFNVWINGKLQTFPGTTTLPAGNRGTTVWPDNPVGGNSKLGLYHHLLRYDNQVEANAEAGHRKMEMFMTDWNDVIRTPADWDYMDDNAFKAVSTASYF